MAITLPVLGGQGFLTDPNTIMSRLYMSIFLTDHSQSNIYQGKVVSIQYILAEHGDDEVAISNAVQKAVTEVYSRYFTGVTVGFKPIASTTLGISESALAFTLDVSGDMNGVTYDLSKIIKTDSSGTMRKFVDAF